MTATSHKTFRRASLLVAVRLRRFNLSLAASHSGFRLRCLVHLLLTPRFIRKFVRSKENANEENTDISITGTGGGARLGPAQPTHLTSNRYRDT